MADVRHRSSTPWLGFLAGIVLVGIVVGDYMVLNQPWRQTAQLEILNSRGVAPSVASRSGE